jgi:hypothetical protein
MASIRERAAAAAPASLGWERGRSPAAFGVHVKSY